MNTHYLEMMESLDLDSTNMSILVETGTHRGEGAHAWSTLFNEVHTIELSDSLYDHCIKTYDLPNVNFIKAASTDVLKELVEGITENYLLLLDAHGSGGDTTFDERVGRFGAPVLQEIECVRSNPPEWILVDDLSDFESINTYPTKQAVIEKALEIGEYEVSEYKSKVMTKGVLVLKKK